MGRIYINNCNSENIAYLCDVDQDFAARTYEAYPDAKVYTDYRRMLDREKSIDAVVIGTPDHTHAVIAMAAMVETPGISPEYAAVAGQDDVVYASGFDHPTFLAVAARVGDIRLMVARPTERKRWIKRHLFRMLLAFAFAIRALFAIGIETGLPFEFVVTAPLVLALIATWYFFRKLGDRV